MELITIGLELVKGLSSETVVMSITLILLIFSLWLKKSDVDLSQVTSISKLQTDQLSQLIEQNANLAEELHAVRKELTEAYKVIDDMRNRITELEGTLKRGVVH